MKVKVLVEETLSRTVEVEADSPDDAVEMVRQQYNREEIVLDESDFDGEVLIQEMEE
jgi:hypothetical protein